VGDHAAGLSRRVVELQPRVVRDESDGRISLRLSARERAILGAYLAELRDLVGVVVDPPAEPAVDPAAELAVDPAVARLYPAAIPDDPAADAAFRDLTRADLEDTRRTRLATVEATLDARSIDDAQATAWMGTLNDLRLVLGTRLGVTDETEGQPIDEDDPDADRRIVYAYAGWLLEQFVDALAGALPDVRE
jgi:hypothetical protein